MGNRGKVSPYVGIAPDHDDKLIFRVVQGKCLSFALVLLPIGFARARVAGFCSYRRMLLYRDVCRRSRIHFMQDMSAPGRR